MGGSNSQYLSWSSLENDPQIFKEYAKELCGLNLDIQDVFDPSAISEDDFVVLIFNVKDRARLYENFHPYDQCSNLIKLRQTIDNSCGTIALLHVLLNYPGFKPVVNQSVFTHVVEMKTIDEIQLIGNLHAKYAGGKPKYFRNPSPSHSESANEGQQHNGKDSAYNTFLHFVVFKKIHDQIILLDGLRDQVLST